MKLKSVTGILMLLLIITCQASTSEGERSPAHYDLDHPEVFKMPNELTEISGHAFYKENSDTIYAEQDESGSVYTLVLGTDYLRKSTFKKKGDFEDISIYNETVIMLRSDGKLFLFPFESLQNEKIKSYRVEENLLPKGEYEGLYADEATDQLYVLCKDCKADDPKKEVSVFVFDIKENTTLEKAGSFAIDAEAIAKKHGGKKTKFKPSALAFNPKDKKWYIVSSINKALVVADKDFNVEEVFPLKRSVYPQPEGIAFDKEGHLFLSSEGSKHKRGRIYRIPYKE